MIKRSVEEREQDQPPEEFAGLKRRITEQSRGVEDEDELNIKKWDILSRRLLRKD